jgi:hypothetical protein
MNFLALMITLLLRQLRGVSDWVQRDEWFRRWETRVATWQLGSVGHLAMVVLPPLVVAQLLLNAVQTRPGGHAAVDSPGGDHVAVRAGQGRLPAAHGTVSQPVSRG